MRSVAQELYEPIQQHALREYPKESMGIIVDGYVKNRVVFGEYVPLPNSHPTPTTHGKISRQDMEPFRSRMTALVHSHPDGWDCPSAHDMAQQQHLAMPSIVVWTNGSNANAPFAFGDQLGRPDLMEREFRSGVTDCASALRDCLHEKYNIEIPDQPRDWLWWLNSEKSFYYDLTKPYGFRVLTEAEARDPQPGDCFFLALRSKVPNHGGVYIGDGMIYHHPGSDRGGPHAPRHRSVIEYAMRWIDLRPTLIRYDPNEENRTSRSSS